MMFNVFCLSQKKMRLHHAWKQMGVQEYNVGSGAFAMCNVQTSSKSKSTDKTMKNPSIFQSVEISRLSCHFRATFFFSVSQSQAPFHCCLTSSVLWRGSLQKFCQDVRCRPSRFIGEDTLVCKPYEHQPLKQVEFWRRWHWQRLVKRVAKSAWMSAEAQAQQERT